MIVLLHAPVEPYLPVMVVAFPHATGCCRTLTDCLCESSPIGSCTVEQSLKFLVVMVPRIPGEVYLTFLVVVLPQVAVDLYPTVLILVVQEVPIELYLTFFVVVVPKVFSTSLLDSVIPQVDLNMPDSPYMW